MVTLENNPFSAAGIPRRDAITWADRRLLRDWLQGYVKEPPNKWTDVRLLVGDYGSGKTHSLLYAEFVCREEKIPTVHLHNPGNSFMDFAFAIFAAIGFDKILLASNELLERDKTNILKSLEKNNLQKIVRVEGLSIDRMLKYVFPSMDPNLSLVLGQAQTGRNIDSARAWLLGKHMVSGELSKLNVSSSIESDDYASKILADVLRIITRDSGQSVLLVDELEDIANMSRTTAISFEKNLRRLIDENVEGLKILFAFTMDAFRQFLDGTGGFQGRLYPALRDRLRPYFEIQPLTEKETADFIQDFVSREFTGTLDQVITPAAIVEIQKQTRGVPREVITKCHRLFERAMERKSFPISIVTLPK
jgi:type II secretory pathway predicted ATPase ExeA